MKGLPEIRKNIKKSSKSQFIVQIYTLHANKTLSSEVFLFI